MRFGAVLDSGAAPALMVGDGDAAARRRRVVRNAAVDAILCELCGVFNVDVDWWGWC